MFFVIWTTLALIQLGQAENLPLSFYCDDQHIKDIAQELNLVKLMNENMQLKIEALSMSIKEQLNELKTALNVIDIHKAVTTASKVSNFSTTPTCDCNAILMDLSTNSTATDISNTTTADNSINANSKTSGDYLTGSDGVISNFCQRGRSGIQTIQIPNSKLTPSLVNCIQDSQQGDDPWILIQRRNDGNINFFRDWSDYKEGFGNLNGEFFIGLDKLHTLTQSASYELWIQLEDFTNGTRWAKYSNFSIGDESESYALNTLGNFTGTAGDSFSDHIGYKFTTKDKDNDVHNTFNCAERFIGAWWYNKCYRSNLNGKYIHCEYSLLRGQIGITWSSWRHDVSLKYVHMAIRPVKLSQYF